MKNLKKLFAVLCAAMFLLTGMTFPEAAEAEVSINVPLSISASDLTYPTTLEKGDPFSLRGTVRASYGTITRINVTITNRKTKKVVVNKNVYPKTQSVNIRSTINNKVQFGKLAVGNYTLKMSAYAQKGKKKASRVLINHGFTVKDAKPKLYIDGLVYPTKINQGNQAPIRGVINTTKGKITNVWAYVIDSNGRNVMVAKYQPNRRYFDLHYTLNTDFIFEVLPAGIYTFKIVAKAVNGKSTTQTVLVEDTLKVQ